MPPRAKFTKDEIIAKALSLVEKKGIACLTARELGKELNSSSRPIFTVYNSMDDVVAGVIEQAKAEYKRRIAVGLSETVAFRGVGTQYILFAIEKPKLFELLFMTRQKIIPTLNGVLPVIDDSYDLILNSIVQEYGLDTEKSKKVYKHLWIYTHGIATLCVTNMCKFSEEDIASMMREVCMSIVTKLREEAR